MHKTFEIIQKKTLCRLLGLLTVAREFVDGQIYAAVRPVSSKTLCIGEIA